MTWEGWVKSFHRCGLCIESLESEVAHRLTNEAPRAGYTVDVWALEGMSRTSDSFPVDIRARTRGGHPNGSLRGGPICIQ